MSDHFIDGIRLAANRSNEACGRSWHIPAKPGFRPSFVMVVFGLVLAAVALVGAAAEWLS